MKPTKLFLFALSTALCFSACKPDEPDTEIRVRSVEIEQQSPLFIEIGGYVRLTAKVLPADATDKKLIWESADPAIASVDRGGIVTGLAEGTTQIVVASESRASKGDTCIVTVSQPVPATAITITPASATMIAGDTLTLTAALLPANSTSRIDTWTVSNPSVAELTLQADGSCRVAAIAEGTAAVTVRTNNGKIAVCTIHVIALDGDVYIAGSNTNNSGAVWKNGVLQTHLIGGQCSGATGIYVASNNDVYVKGGSSGSGNFSYTIWKNGAEFASVSYGNYFEVFGMRASNNKFYSLVVPVYDYENIILWTAGQSINSIDTLATNSWKPSDIDVFNNNIYIVGRRDYKPVYLINGIENQLPGIGEKQHGFAEAIVVKNSDVYIAGKLYKQGYADESIVLWTNETPVLTGMVGSIRGFFVEGANVYIIVSRTYGSPQLWKNGVITELTNLRYADCIFVKNGNEYIGGRTSDSKGRVLLNGSVLYDDLGQHCTSIFVK